MDIINNLLEEILKEKENAKKIRDERNRDCEFCGKDLSSEVLKLVKGNKVSCIEHKKLGEDGWLLDILG